MQQKSLARVQKTQMPEILREIEKFITRHLKKHPYILAVTVQDHIDLLFEEKFREDHQLKAVMSLLCEHEALTPFQLRRDTRRWGHADGIYVCYSVIPPWAVYCGKEDPNLGSTEEIAKLLTELDRATLPTQEKACGGK